MITFASNGCTGAQEGFELFKSFDGVAFNPALHIDPEYVIAQYGSGVTTKYQSFKSAKIINFHVIILIMWSTKIY
ncbi:MAG: hypothetical protein IPF63_10330 [Bacteroidetes bacterium]|nr:hypothetical protein [Bacteroidota bacterium]